MSRGRGPDDGPDGVLVVHKPAGPTSHDIVGLVRRLAGTRRIGHGGTLDPFASGVLPLFLGAATRLAEYHLGREKRYRATVCFGASSTTDDLEGEIAPADRSPDRAAVEAALDGFRGPIEQRPPDYSAVKVGGRRAYAMARAGITPELRPRAVTIHALELLAWDASDPGRPIGTIDLTCSAGTYVRSLARDLGAATGSAAYLGSLVRTSSGSFGLEDAVSVEAIREAATRSGAAGVAGLLRPVDAGLEWMPRATVTDAVIPRLLQGQAVPPVDPSMGPADPVRVTDGAGRLLAIGSISEGVVAPRKVLTRPSTASRDTTDA